MDWYEVLQRNNIRVFDPNGEVVETVFYIDRENGSKLCYKCKTVGNGVHDYFNEHHEEFNKHIETMRKDGLSLEIIGSKVYW